ncbi:TPA: hypothetical protein JIS15_04085 [Acinetobacter baumannii]|nr:hypothetical protein [Acinetobacter baumannii]
MNQYHWVELGTAAPLYTVFAKTEKQAMSKLRKYLTKVGKDKIELARVIG